MNDDGVTAALGRYRADQYAEGGADGELDSQLERDLFTLADAFAAGPPAEVVEAAKRAVGAGRWTTSYAPIMGEWILSLVPKE